MIEEIKLSESVSVYKTKIEIENMSNLISDIRLNLDISLGTKKPTPTEPGIQSPILITTDSLSELNTKIVSVLLQNFNLDKSTPYTSNQWIYISENTNKYFGLHKHDAKSNTIIKPKWTYTYYVQMPDNLIEDDGKLMFQLDNGDVHMILPMVSDLLIFPADLLHAPINNPNSNLERIVIAGMWSDIDVNVEFKKKNKTLI